MLEREIGFLEEELKSVERIPPASRSCKEVADFVIGNVDPLIPTIKKTRRSCRFWKWLCGVCCFDISWNCCCSCSWDLGMPRCSDCMTSTAVACLLSALHAQLALAQAVHVILNVRS
ncbi:guanine nucleotide-binding protein subunit gamma [Perilla frutescens var. frutescens]|nr:guanine nucleotide-binding protein subunit gamma [Perilla frutescens var. frutescens]